MARVCHTFLRLLSWWLWIFSWYASSTVQSAPQIQNEKSNKSKPESAAVQWFFNMPSSNPMLNSCVCFVVVVFGWIEVALSAIHKLPESSRCPPRSRACTRWALCVPLCTVWHCVALCGTVWHCTVLCTRWVLHVWQSTFFRRFVPHHAFWQFCRSGHFIGHANISTDYG